MIVMKRQTAVVAATMMGALLALTGCTADKPEVTPSATTEPVATQTETPAPEPTPTQEPAPAPGPDEGAPGAQYTLADGTKVSVDPHAPLPAEVVADAKATAGVRSTSPASSAEVLASAAPRTAAADKVEATGKIAVFVIASGVYDPTTDTLVESFFALSSRDADFRGATTAQSADEAIAVAQGIIAGKADPSLYEIIDLTR